MLIDCLFCVLLGGDQNSPAAEIWGRTLTNPYICTISLGTEGNGYCCFCRDYYTGEKKTHKVVREVESWLNDANSLMAKVVDVQEKTKRNKISCLKHCPNLINRYNLAKRLEEKTNEIKTHSQVQFSEFSRLSTLVEIIHLEGLNEDESWALFQKHAALSHDLSDDLKEMAQNITKVCDGLPIAIEAVAKTLKNKPHDEWDEALEILRNPRIDIEEGLK
ncbi:hypothetical protein K1719_041119 [Acacia pycnantha]|nr:hypothetical protein K1719_041119 [Acacia pycnantha]